LIDRHTLLAYGALGLPLALLGLPLFVYLPAFYATDLGLGLTGVGAVLLAARAFDVVSDPLVGAWSDRHATRWGRRLPWMALGLPLLLPGVHALFVPPADAGLGYLLGWSFLTYLGWTLVALPYQALGAELSPDYHQRAHLTASREGAVILGTVLAVGLAGVVQARGGDAAATLAALALPLLITLPLAFLWLAWRIREAPGAVTRPLAGRAGWALLRANQPFRRLLLAWLLNGMANALPATLVLMFIAEVLALPQYTGLFLGAYFVSGVLTLPLWLAASRRFGKHRVWCASMLWAALVFACVPLLGAGDLVPFVLVCVLSGASLGVDNALPAAMQADVIDADRAAGGGERAGLYFGLWGMATKAALALAVGIAFPLLDALNAVLPDAGDRALTWLYAGLPVLLKLGVLPLVWNFPLDATAQAALRARLAAAT
jgi:GPH family glycoside/pentoside/hexuronide:cation symporter